MTLHPGRLLAAALLLAATAWPLGAGAETLRFATLKTGTVNWELDTIKHYELDKKAGFEMEILEMAGNPATRIAFQGGEADSMVADWLWVARQRAEGKDYVFIPYSTAVGGLLVAPDSPVQKLSDLKGGKIGIAGGPLDKSWLILLAYAKKTEGLDLAAETEQVFGAPPLIFQNALQREIDATINFWHFLAKMKAKGFREVVSVAEASTALGLDPETPLLGYVVSGDLVNNKPELAKGLAEASRAAKTLLATDDAAWERLRPMMNVADDAEFEALKAGYRAGIPGEDSVDVEAARSMYALMAELGGEELVGAAKTLPDGVFYQGE